MPAKKPVRERVVLNLAEPPPADPAADPRVRAVFGPAGAGRIAKRTSKKGRAAG